MSYAQKEYKSLKLTSKITLIANLFAALALLISYSASFIDPNIFWPIAFFGLAFLPLLLLNLIFILYWILKNIKYALLSIVCILVGWPLLTQHIKLDLGSNPDISKKNDSTLRVMSYNTHLFKPIENEKNKDFTEETINILHQIEPDIICFQEFYTKGEDKLIEKIKKEGNFKDYFFDAAVKNKSDAYGQIIFSKYPIVHSGTVTEYNYGINRISYADVIKQSDTIRVYNVHLRSFALQNEDKEFFQKLASNEFDEQFPKKLSGKLRAAFNHRSQQATALKKHIKETTNTAIVMGDFNDTPMSYAVNLIGEKMNNAFREKGKGWGVTHFEMLPLFQIDYILTSKDIQVRHYEIIKKKLSDHYPIWADLQL